MYIKKQSMRPKHKRKRCVLKGIEKLLQLRFGFVAQMMPSYALHRAFQSIKPIDARVRVIKLQPYKSFFASQTLKVFGRRDIDLFQTIGKGFSYIGHVG
jgi:hypothetical protein